MPDSTILVDYMLARVTDLVKNLIGCSETST